MKPNIFVHGCYVGTTGYNNHTRDFFRELSKYLNLKIRNFTVGKSWAGLSDRCHDGESNLNDLDKSILYEQSLWNNGNLEDHKIYQENKGEFVHDFNLVLAETNHHYFYQNYLGPKIAYNVWESTRQPEDFFKKLLEFDELWVPSEWQKKCSIEQGFPEDKVQVVPEGVDVSTFFPEKVDLLDEYKDGRFKFILFGRWDYRKSTKEIIQTFLKTFSEDEPVDLIVSIDNMWGEQMDGYKSTEERLAAYGLVDERIKIVHFPSREDYIKFIKTGHVFVSCARSEGWNLPLIESMACGTPSIYSDCSAQLEFAQGLGLPVKIKELKAANANDYGRYKMSDLPGDYYEPDFEDLSNVMRYAYQNYQKVKTDAMKDSEVIRKSFSWERIGQIGYEKCLLFKQKMNSDEFKSKKKDNQILVSYMDGPKVEIVGDHYKKYKIEFLDEKDNVVHSSNITTGMWTSCARKYYTKWKILVDGIIVDEFDLTNKRVLISMESKSIGDTIAWAPYVVKFAKKHNCKVILSTFHNQWFKDHPNYQGIEFIEPGRATECFCVFRLGYFRDEKGYWKRLDMYPNQVNTIPLQKVATDILGLDYQELNLGINYIPRKRLISEKYVVIAPESTAGCKEWIYDNWVKLSNSLIEQGYKVVVLTSKPYKIENTINVWNQKWLDVFTYLFHAEIFIGLSSGLSWINWALNKKTVMIAGFSESYNEFISNNIRISNDVCIKCWNDSALMFDPGDWNWCPVYKGTEKQHICQRSITVDQVLNKLPL